jgi:monofunctional biosynthetic peptidoglycan transglycosylase
VYVRGGKRSLLRRAIGWLVLAIVSYFITCLFALVLLRWFDPPFTSVHVQRRVEAWINKTRYQKRFTFVPLERISPHLQHAVIAAEDGGFYHHYGIDVAELQKVIKERRESFRGGSTISMQLIKNLFVTTHRNPLRKVIEWGLVFPAEVILGKQRILELYLNVIEWGPGVYGAEAAARYHYKRPALTLDRDQATRLAAVIPAPRSRRPARMNQYSAEIQARMTKMGW